jgi:hypothetical protein
MIQLNATIWSSSRLRFSISMKRLWNAEGKQVNKYCSTNRETGENSTDFLSIAIK